MTPSIVTSLGAGSGIDIRSLVDQLANAAKAPADAALNRRAEANSARISALAEIGSAIDGLSSAMTTLIAGGTLSSQPSVSDPTALGATASVGSDLGQLSSQIEIVRLASAQTLSSAPLTNATAPVGQGALTVTHGGTSFAVTIDASNDSLEGLAAAINAAGSPVRASLLNDTTGTRLVLRGATGDAGAFTIAAAPGATAGLDRFAYAAGGTGAMQLATTAQDSIAFIDGVETRSAGNRLVNILPGVTLELKRPTAGAIVALGTTRPTAALRTGLEDFVAAYNEVMGAIATATANTPGGVVGPARGDTAIAALRRQMAALPTSLLSNRANAPQTLAEIGVRTNRDGTLTIDATRLNSVLSRDAADVEALVAPQTGGGVGLGGALKSIRDSLRSGNGPFAASNSRLSSEARRIASDREVLERRSEKYYAQLLATYTAMDRQVSASRATQSYLEQQVQLWTRSNG
jgi:flagellar hook-associated protein 2